MSRSLPSASSSRWRCCRRPAVVVNATPASVSSSRPSTSTRRSRSPSASAWSALSTSPQRPSWSTSFAGSWGLAGQQRPYRTTLTNSSLLRSLLLRGAMKRLDTHRNRQCIGTCRSRSSFRLVGGRPRSGRTPDKTTPFAGQVAVAAARSSFESRPRYARPYRGPCLLRCDRSAPAAWDRRAARGRRPRAPRALPGAVQDREQERHSGRGCRDTTCGVAAAQPKSEVWGTFEAVMACVIRRLAR
jgi:hypothetical protein